ncbi:hypothetical protein SDC9_07996 [bioreactor metagenome]|uniref:Oxidized purine nucleoside triphosphate hydrolase n=1 Tax=bioreactor metagenome TaxID=1076179 RepID=A0A644T609_9ZZZZ|nr:8-oxo-dGTP diphosphatase [Candidatus Elulimicrobiales bacterium]
MKLATLLFLIEKKNNKINRICLSMKKRGFGVGRYNGVGGKVEKDETVEEACKREVLEEIGVEVLDMKKVAELEFIFSEKPDWNQKVFTFFCEEWKGHPEESEEMNPKWFLVGDIPFHNMWSDDIFWLPKVLENELVKARFVFDNNDTVQDQELKSVEHF